MASVRPLMLFIDKTMNEKINDETINKAVYLQMFQSKCLIIERSGLAFA